MAQNLDETDLQILKTLQKNAKLTTKELADAVHLTPTPVFEREIESLASIESTFVMSEVKQNYGINV